MSESSTLADIFGHSAWSMIKATKEIEVIDVDASNRSCTVIINGLEYVVKREHHRGWHVETMGHRWTFNSQWELRTWISDRL